MVQVQLDCPLEIHSDITKLISDKLEYSEAVSRFWTFVLLLIVAHTLRQ